MTSALASPFTHAVQRVGSNPLHTEPQGPTDLDGFIRAIDVFPWIEQHIAWNETQEGPLPAVVLQNTASKSELWVTALASPTANDVNGIPEQWVLTDYQLHHVSIKPHKTLFGFGKEVMKESAETASAETREEALEWCRLFHQGQTEALERAFERAIQRDRDRFRD